MATRAPTWPAPSTPSWPRWTARPPTISPPTCDAISYGSLMGARGNSGVILSQILRGFAGTLKHQADGRGREVRGGAAGGVRRRVRGGAQADRGHHPHRRAARVPRRPKASADAGGSLVEVLRAARAAGKLALDNTPEQLPVLKDAGVVDAGGAGFLLLLDSALHVVDGEPLPIAEPDDGRVVRSAPRSRRSPTGTRRRRRARRQRAALRGHVLPRPGRRAHPGVQGRLGSDRRLDRRGRWRRPLELPRAHQRDRRRHRGRARPRRAAEGHPGDRPVRGGRRGAREARGGARCDGARRDRWSTRCPR